MPKKKPATMKDLADLKNQNQSSGQSQNAIDETTPTTPAQSQSTTPPIRLILTNRPKRRQLLNNQLVVGMLMLTPTQQTHKHLMLFLAKSKNYFKR